MSRKTINELERQVQRFNAMTGRPERAYEPKEDVTGGKANIGYAYARNLGEQDRYKCSIGVIMNHFGGLTSIPGLSYLPAGELLRVLRTKMKDPAWIELHQFKPKIKQ